MIEIKTYMQRFDENKEDIDPVAKTFCAMQDEITELRAALAEAEKYAGYYIRLRNGDVDNYGVADLHDGIFYGEVFGTELDKAMQGDDS